MIKYALICQDKHAFEAWFASSAAYERQLEAGQIACPSCGTDRVGKALMAPNVVSSRKRASAAAAEPPAAEVIEALRRFRRHVVEQAEYVGPLFAEEARRIHFEEAEARGIYGEATAADVRELLEDGVAVLPLPSLPEDAN
jgi:hypothetical protein